MNLTLTDVKKLTKEPSAKVRSMLAAKIAMDYRSGNFSDNESTIADDIFRILLKDAERKVRKTMAEQLCHCPHVPHDIVLRLAKDETEIAVPVLEYSSVLTDDDLVAIVKASQEVDRLTAIARRDSVPEPVSAALIDTRKKEVFGELFANQGARIPEESIAKSWGDIASEPSLLETLVNRGSLPLPIAEKLFTAVSDELKRQLSRQYKLHTPALYKAAGDAREWETLGIVPTGSGSPDSDDQVEDLVDQLNMGGRLTHSFLIRALCTGNLNVFEAGLARLAGVPRVNARLLLMDNGSLGFGALYKAAGMPEGFTDAVQALLRISLEETDYGIHKRTDFRKRVIDRIYRESGYKRIENMEYLLSIMGGRVGASSLH